MPGSTSICVNVCPNGVGIPSASPELVEAKKITKEKAAAEVETQQRVVVMLKAQAMEVEA